MFICVSKIIVFTHFLPQQFVLLGSKVLKNSNYGKGKKKRKRVEKAPSTLEKFVLRHEELSLPERLRKP